jgi:hypothetical protein
MFLCITSSYMHQASAQKRVEKQIRHPERILARGQGPRATRQNESKACPKRQSWQIGDLTERSLSVGWGAIGLEGNLRLGFRALGTTPHLWYIFQGAGGIFPVRLRSREMVSCVALTPKDA